jgi:anti-sigma regulatory factor (Ser/Thr protein kinase)
MTVTIPFEAALPSTSGAAYPGNSMCPGDEAYTNGTDRQNGAARRHGGASPDGTAHPDRASCLPYGTGRLGDAAAANAPAEAEAFADTWTSVLPRGGHKRPDTWTKSIQLPASARAAGAARDHIRRCIRAWNAANAATRLANARTHSSVGVAPVITSDDTETTMLLTSELVTNALTHGESPVTVAVSWSGEQLRIEVHDRSRYLPTPWPVHMAPDDETGRGLLLVDTLATDWGFYRTPGGKAVYFTLDCPRVAR